MHAMAKSVGGIVLFLLAAALPLTLHADESLMKTLADGELVDILQSEGYRAVERVDERVIKIKIDGHTYVLYIYDDDDLQLYFGLTGYVLTNEHMNDWNRTKRLSRVYLDDENDLVLEADLLANAGYTRKQLMEWLSVFDSAAREFRQFLDENDQGE